MNDQDKKCAEMNTLPNETINDVFDNNTKTWTNYKINGDTSVKCDTCIKRETSNNTYFFNRQSYLDSRGKSLRTHNTISSYDDTSTTNEYELQAGKKCSSSSFKFFKGVLKYSNPQYSKNSAVSSSNRIARLKYETITKNYNSLNNNLLPSYKTNLKYRGHSEAPNILKNKISGKICMKTRGNRRCMKFM